MSKSSRHQTTVPGRDYLPMDASRYDNAERSVMMTVLRDAESVLHDARGTA